MRIIAGCIRSCKKESRGHVTFIRQVHFGFLGCLQINRIHQMHHIIACRFSHRLPRLLPHRYAWLWCRSADSFKGLRSREKDRNVYI